MTALEFPCRYCGEYEEGHSVGKCLFSPTKFSPMAYSDALSWSVEEIPGRPGCRAIPIMREDVRRFRGVVN